MDCEICGKKIPKERLEVLPNTLWCITCAKDVERADAIEAAKAEAERKTRKSA